MQPLPWEPELARACAWVDRHVIEFRVDGARDQQLPSLKAVAELAHAGEILARVADARWHEHGRRWLAHAWAAMRDGAVIEKAIRANPKLVIAATVFVPFHLAGYASEPILRALREQHVRAALNRYEWNLTLAAFGALGLVPDEDVVASARSGSWLAARAPASALTIEQVYLLIHECLYRSAWARDKTWCNAAERAYLDETLPALARRFATDADIVAELLLAMHGQPFTCGAPAAWHLLVERQAETGALLPPARKVTPLERSDAAFAAAYHTTLVAIMAWASCPHAR